MPLRRRNDLHGPARIGSANARNASYAFGLGVLDGAGVLVNNVPGFTSQAIVIAGYAASSPGSTGLLLAGYNAATGDVTVSSSAGAMDAGNIVVWFLID